MQSDIVSGAASNNTMDLPPLPDVVLIGIDCPNDEMLCWAEELADLAVVRSATSFDDVRAPRDTLVVSVWSNGETREEESIAFPNLARILQPSTRVVGICIDSDRSRALASEAGQHFPELCWLRRISDMVVISSDSGVVAELVSTLALAAL